MGFSTHFTGKLDLSPTITLAEIKELKKILGEDCRDHPEWWDISDVTTYIDLQLSDDMDYLEWNFAEKTYDLEKSINVVINIMRLKFPNFSLTGSLKATPDYGEPMYEIIIAEDGYAKVREFQYPSKSIPLSGLSFVLTGMLSLTRKEMEKKIRDLGGVTHSVISNHTSYLLAGAKSGDVKLKEAKDYSVKVINEEEFNKLLLPKYTVEEFDNLFKDFLKLKHTDRLTSEEIDYGKYVFELFVNLLK